MLARTHEGDARTDRLLEMRLEALRMMRLLSHFRPRLIGSVMTGHIRQGSDIDLHLFSDNVSSVAAIVCLRRLRHSFYPSGAGQTQIATPTNIDARSSQTP